MPALIALFRLVGLVIIWTARGLAGLVYAIGWLLVRLVAVVLPPVGRFVAARGLPAAGVTVLGVAFLAVRFVTGRPLMAIRRDGALHPPTTFWYGLRPPASARGLFGLPIFWSWWSGLERATVRLTALGVAIAVWRWPVHTAAAAASLGCLLITYGIRMRLNQRAADRPRKPRRVKSTVGTTPGAGPVEEHTPRELVGR